MTARRWRSEARLVHTYLTASSVTLTACGCIGLGATLWDVDSADLLFECAHCGAVWRLRRLAGQCPLCVLNQAGERPVCRR